MYFIGIYYASFWRAMLIPFFKIIGSKYNKRHGRFLETSAFLSNKNWQYRKKNYNIFKINTKNTFSNKLDTTNNESLV